MGINKVHIVQLLKKKMNTSLYLVVQIWTSIRKREEEEQVIIMFDAGDGLAEVKRRFAEISQTWFHFSF